MRSEGELGTFRAGYRNPWRPLSTLLVLGMLCGACGTDKTSNTPDALLDVGVDNGVPLDSRQPMDNLSPDVTDWDQQDASIPHDGAPEVEDAIVPDDILDSNFPSEDLLLADELSDPDMELLSDILPLEDSETWTDADWLEDSSEDAEVWDVWTADSDIAPDVPELCVDNAPPPWSRNIDLAGGTVVFTEVMYRPGDGSNLAWVELFNPFSIDMDISGWTLAGDVSYLFQESTMIPPGGYLVVASNPGAINQTGPLDVLGPWSGMLPPWTGSIELRNNTDRLMDIVNWSAEEPWPVAAAGSGASLSKLTPLTPSEEAEGWRSSLTPGGTPGEENFPEVVEFPESGRLRFGELGPGGDGFWVELVNLGEVATDLAGVVLATTGGLETTLSALLLQPGERALFSGDEVGFAPNPGDILFLYSSEKATVLDAVKVTHDARARLNATNLWYHPKLATPGGPNTPPEPANVVINELMYHHAPIVALGGTQWASGEEWVELHNTGDTPVDLSGWSLVDAVEFQFPQDTILPGGDFLVVAKDADVLDADFPEIQVIGDMKGKLSNSGERLALLDACGDLVDEVRYADGGRWPNWADGGGSSLELRDPLADNSSPEAWGASVESDAAVWETFFFSEVLSPSLVGPDGRWEELVLGLLDAGEVLIDDLSLIEDPDGVAVEMLQNGTFEGSEASAWRLLGNHRFSEVIEDPDEPGNHVLKLVATGSTEHMHNHAETTLANGASIQNGTLYTLSFRARWVAGSNQLNSRLYFNRMAHTVLLERPPLNGTPGHPNSQLVENLGPTYSDLSHSPVVPAPFEPVDIAIRAKDPDGVKQLIVLYSRNEAPADVVPMLFDGVKYVAQIPGAPAETVTQFWVEGIDETGAWAPFPQGGPDSRALFKAVNPPLDTPPMHTLRILLTPEDDQWLFAPENLMSNDRIGATVIWDETEIFYDVGVRIKGSERGRPTSVRVGFSIRFQPDKLFRGVYQSIMVDRSEGVHFGQREMLINLMMAHAGSVSAEYNDLVYLYAPRDEHSSTAELQLARFGDQMLAFQFEDGEAGSLYEYELIYYPTTTTDGSPESPKLPQPDLVVGTPITSLGDDKEAYRLVYTVKNNRLEDDFTHIMAFAKAFGEAGSDFTSVMPMYMDVDQWLRAFAFSILADPVDNYGTGAKHNVEFYVRPSDNRVLFFPHDLDFYGGNPQNAVTASPDLQRIISSPTLARLFYGHIVDIVETSYNGDYMSHWCNQLGDLLPDQDFAAHLDFITTRAAWVLTNATNSVFQSIPQVSFEITTNGGAEFQSTTAVIDLEGQGWVDVRTIWRTGTSVALPLSWTDQNHWSASVYLSCGPNLIELEARNHQNQLVGSDSVVVSRVGGSCP